MFLPINTDAPIYYFPWMTIALIVTNVACFAAMMVGDVEAFVPWTLVHGDGLHPLTWVSSAFIHGDIFHLLGNMFFLWGFGLVVEGKLGPWWFLLLYLGLAIAGGLIEQVGMLGYEGQGSISYGASGVIFSLLAMSFIWAPKNEMTIFLFLGIHSTVFEATIYVFCGLYIAMQVVFAAIGGFSMSSEMLHLIGVFVGAIAGVVLLKTDLVDCEGWDIFAVMSGNYGGSKRLNEEFAARDAAYREMTGGVPGIRVASEPKTKADKVKASQLDPKARLAKFMADGDMIAAFGEYEKLRAFDPMWQPDAATLLTLGEGCLRDKDYEAAEPLLNEYLARHAAADPTATARVRLKLAKLLLDVSRKPGEALRLLKQVDPAAIPPKAQAAHQELVKRAMQTPRKG